MTWRTWVLAIALIGVPTLVAAQEHRGHAAHGEAAGAVPAGSGGMMSCPMMAEHMSRMGGMRAMGSRGEASGMGHRMDGPAMGMGMMEMMPMPGADADPKTRARWMQMRGEMMKAMGEIMMKHGAMMQGAPAK